MQVLAIDYIPLLQDQLHCCLVIPIPTDLFNFFNFHIIALISHYHSLQLEDIFLLKLIFTLTQTLLVITFRLHPYY